MSYLDFNTLRAANRRRLPRFQTKDGKPAHSRSDGSDWDVATWIMALIGELGEVAQVRLDYENHLISKKEYEEAMKRELADVACYLDLVALRAFDMPPQPEDMNMDPPHGYRGMPMMSDARLCMGAMAKLGYVANLAKKFVRGDETRGGYIERKFDPLEDLRSYIFALENSKGVKCVPTKAAHRTGINLGEAIVTKFNEVSDRVKAGVWISKDGVDILSDGEDPPYHGGQEMSARINGQSLWLVRPIDGDLIDDNAGYLFCGDHAAMVAHIADMHRTTGRQHAAREVEQ